jgi:hypothetical protein
MDKPAIIASDFDGKNNFADIFNFGAVSACFIPMVAHFVKSDPLEGKAGFAAGLFSQAITRRIGGAGIKSIQKT